MHAYGSLAGAGATLSKGARVGAGRGDGETDCAWMVGAGTEARAARRRCSAATRAATSPLSWATLLRCAAAAWSRAVRSARRRDASERARPRTSSRAARFASRSSRRSEEHTSELQSRQYLVCRLLLE